MDNNDGFDFSMFSLSVASLLLTMTILDHIEEQLALTRKSIEDNKKFHRELFQLLERIINNQ